MITSILVLAACQVLTCLQVWDTAGEDQADLLDSSFWSNASGAVIVCNLHRTDCISSLTFWQNKLQQVQYMLSPPWQAWLLTLPQQQERIYLHKFAM